MPGKVFFTLNNKSGLFAIDAESKAVAAWPVEGPLVTPAYLDADPTGQFLFAAYDRYVVAIDIATRRVVGRVITATGARIAFDPERRLLITVEQDVTNYPRLSLTGYRVEDAGLTKVTRLDNPPDGQLGLESLRTGGFLQSGRLSLLVWRPVASPTSAGLH